MRKTLRTSNKYCYECGRLIPVEKKTCICCKTDLRVFKKQLKIKCTYCGRSMPEKANFCRYCCYPSLRYKKQKEALMLKQLETAAKDYQEKKDKERYNRNKLKFARCRVNCIHAYGRFKGAGCLHIKTGNDAFKVQTLEFGEETIPYCDFISCHRVSSRKANNYYKIPTENRLFMDVVVISTTRGIIVLEDDQDAEDFIASVYHHLSENVVEFDGCFYNADHDGLFVGSPA